MSADKSFGETFLTSAAIKEAARRLSEAERQPPVRFYPVMPVSPILAERLMRFENFEALHTYISDVKPLQGEIGRIRHSAEEYTRLVMGDWQGGYEDAKDH